MSTDALNADDRLAIADQIDYYRARAPEYDDWFHRRGLYDQGPELNHAWHTEVAELRDALDAAQPSGRILELACGTGLWTAQLADHTHDITCVDASPEMIAFNRQRLRRAHVRYVEADLFGWQPAERYDFVFFGFWLSHVPTAWFIPFWAMVARCLAPDGRVFFVDSRYHPASRTVDHATGDPSATRSRRCLQDGREFEIVKIFYRPADLEQQVSMLGWRGAIHATPNFFLHGALEPTQR